MMVDFYLLYLVKNHCQLVSWFSCTNLSDAPPAASLVCPPTTHQFSWKQAAGWVAINSAFQPSSFRSWHFTYFTFLNWSEQRGRHQNLFQHFVELIQRHHNDPSSPRSVAQLQNHLRKTHPNSFKVLRILMPKKIILQIGLLCCQLAAQIDPHFTWIHLSMSCLWPYINNCHLVLFLKLQVWSNSLCQVRIILPWIARLARDNVVVA